MPTFTSEMSLLFWFDQMVQKKARSSYLLIEMWGLGFFCTIWSNQKCKDIFDIKVAMANQII